MYRARFDTGHRCGCFGPFPFHPLQTGGHTKAPDAWETGKESLSGWNSKETIQPVAVAHACSHVQHKDVNEL